MQDNDIVLCDGDCGRAYHEQCLQPRIRVSELPEDDGWLCHACDAKVESHESWTSCIQLSSDAYQPAACDSFRHDSWQHPLLLFLRRLTANMGSDLLGCVCKTVLLSSRQDARHGVKVQHCISVSAAAA